VLGESVRDPNDIDPGSIGGRARGVYGYSETGYGGWFQTGQIGANVMEVLRH
jgi:hypothetical protein